VARTGTASRGLWNNAPNSASVAEAITLAMMALLVRMAPFYSWGGVVTRMICGMLGFALKKKVPPARLRALASDTYEA
jgi:hypothetical protein